MLLITRKENEKVNVAVNNKLLSITVMGTNDYGETILGFEGDRKDFKISRVEKPAKENEHNHYPAGAPKPYFRG